MNAAIRPHVVARLSRGEHRCLLVMVDLATNRGTVCHDGERSALTRIAEGLGISKSEACKRIASLMDKRRWQTMGGEPPVSADRKGAHRRYKIQIRCVVPQEQIALCSICIVRPVHKFGTNQTMCAPCKEHVSNPATQWKAIAHGIATTEGIPITDATLYKMGKAAKRGLWSSVDSDGVGYEGIVSFALKERLFRVEDAERWAKYEFEANGRGWVAYEATGARRKTRAVEE